MKKLVALVLALSLVAGLSSVTLAAVAKKAAAKKVTKKKVVKKKVAKKVVKPAPKPAAPWVPPAPAPVAPAPAPAPAVKAAGMGLSLGGSVGLKAGLFDIAGILTYSTDSILSGTAVRLGVDYLAGTNPGLSADSMKAINVSLGATYALTMLKSADIPIDWYVGANYVLPVKVNAGATASGWGADAILGGTYKIPDFGTICGELGYGVLKYESGKTALRGIDATVGYNYSF